MIDGDEFMTLLMAACPSFGDPWSQELAEAAASGLEPVRIVIIDELGRHLGMLHRQGRTEEFPAVFAVVELGLTEGNELADALADELVEDLCFDNGPCRAPEYFEPFLGPAATARWRELRRLNRPPDPRADEVLAVFVDHNPAKLVGDLVLEYRQAARNLPELLDVADLLELFRRIIWVHMTSHIPQDLIGEEPQYAGVAETLWDQWHGHSVRA